MGIVVMFGIQCTIDGSEFWMTVGEDRKLEEGEIRITCGAESSAGAMVRSISYAEFADKERREVEAAQSAARDQSVDRACRQTHSI